jgi:hypothetical protein
MHDRNGTLLKVGDIVNIPGKVVSCSANEEYCNVTIQLSEPMYPETRLDNYTLNARQVFLVKREPANAPEAI